MSVKFFISVAAMATITGLATTSALAQISIPTVLIGNAGNAADPSDGDQDTAGVQSFGAVAYVYRIGTTEVTNAQYAAFLNAVAATDTHSLYDTNMASSFGGITRSGASGSFTYATVSGRENNPVNYVTFWDACRFANWLHNGQPTGPQDNASTESGAYTLGGVTEPDNTTVSRNAGWRWAVPSENEWYKAAYHQPADQGGDTDNFWRYAGSSNTITPAQANMNESLIANTRPVGSYAANFYGTFDMTGNVAEWNEAISTTSRFVRGGSYGVPLANQGANVRFITDAGSAGSTSRSGFRVVALPPRPPISIPTVLIGNAGNAADPSDGDQAAPGVQSFGAVAYEYKIGTTEVTNAQYAAFLNAVAATDTHGLYNANMGGFFGGITRSGSPGSYTYAIVGSRANNPVNYVTFWDACRFANWLHNGQPGGAQDNVSTESGAYTLGGVTEPVNASVTRNAGWRWALPSENEWYKAAYHQPASQGGDTDNFWQYARSSNTITPSQANMSESQFANTRPVRSYAANFYGTFDMTGNVAEWNEAISASSRYVRGGSFGAPLANQGANLRFITDAGSAGSTNRFGIRVVAFAPPPQCDTIDFNNNTVFPEDQDVIDFFDVLAGGSPATCDPVQGCNDIDFNNNGVFPEDQDVIDFFNVLAGGSCP